MPPGITDDFLFVVWDSCRLDTFEAARTPVLDRYGPVRPAYTHGTYTLPAHVAMLGAFRTLRRRPFYNRRPAAQRMTAASDAPLSAAGRPRTDRRCARGYAPRRR
jgi:hypothetical protein